MIRNFRRVPRLVVVLTVCALVLAVALIANLSPWLRGGYGWRWPYEPPPLARVIPLVVAVSVYVAGAWMLLRRSSRRAPLLVWSLVGAALIPLMVILQRSDNVTYELFVRTASPLTTGPHHAAAHIRWNVETLRTWPETMDYLQTIGNRHAALGPPGLPLWYHLLNTLLDDMPGRPIRCAGRCCPTSVTTTTCSVFHPAPGRLHGLEFSCQPGQRWR